MMSGFKVALAAGIVGAALMASPAPAQSLPSGTTAGSPGAQWDGISWSIFANAISPAGSQVLFETWATDGDTYTANPHWPTTAEAKATHKARFHVSFLSNARLGAHPLSAQPAGPGGGQCVVPQPSAITAGNFPPTACIAEEVRRNQASFDYIVDNKLYTTAQLKQNFSAGPIAFPWNAVELKADWIPVANLITWMGMNGVTLTQAQVTQQYYTTTDGGTQYALVGVHISSKVLPDWLWATFEHQLNPGRCDTMGCYDSFGATTASIQPSATANTQYGNCTKTPALQALFAAEKLNPVWGNYCLKETQIAFTSANLSIIDGNSVIERINADDPIATTSCITCHKAAAFNNSGTPNFAGLGASPIGNYTVPTGFKGYDFVWGFITIQ